MTRNVGITLTDLAYQVYQEIPHGLRSRIISEFLTENAKELTSLESPYKRINERIHLNKTKAEDNIKEILRKHLSQQ
jgi:hypothetical protein